MAKSRNRPKREKAKPSRQAEIRAQRKRALLETATGPELGRGERGGFDRLERGGFDRGAR